MMKSTETAIRAIAGADPEVTEAQLLAALAALNGKTALTDQTPIDRALTPKQVGELLGVSTKTVRNYARRGLIRGIETGDERGAIRSYSAASVRALLAGGKEVK